MRKFSKRKLKEKLGYLVNSETNWSFFSNYWKTKTCFQLTFFLFVCLFIFFIRKKKVKRKWKAVGGWPGDTSLLLLCTAHCSVGPRLRPNNHVRICVWHFCSYRVFFMTVPVFSLLGGTRTSSFLIPFGSGLEVPSQYASNSSFSPWYNLWRR